MSCSVGISTRELSLLAAVATAAGLGASHWRAAAPSTKPFTPRIGEKVLAEISGRGRIVDVYVSRQGEMLWIEEYPDHTQAVLLNGKLMGAYYDQLKYVAES